MKRIALRLNSRTVTGIIAFGRLVAAKMKENIAVFDAPPVDLKTFTDDLDLLEGYEQIALNFNGNKENTIKRNLKLATIKDDFFLLQCYVQIVSKGDEDIITLAGMEVANSSTHRYGSIVPPVNVRAKNTLNTGEVKMDWSPVRNARQYAVQYCLNVINEDSWQNGLYANGSSLIIKDMPPLQKLYLRVQSLGAAGKSAFSDPIAVNVT